MDGAFIEQNFFQALVNASPGVEITAFSLRAWNELEKKKNAKLTTGARMRARLSRTAEDRQGAGARGLGEGIQGQTTRVLTGVRGGWR